MPLWVETLGAVSLGLSAACATIILVDIAAGNRQHMWIMNVVWPVTALYAGPVALYAYVKLGRRSTDMAMQRSVCIAK